MKYWKNGNDLYTGDTAPSGAVEITEQEYNDIMASREITHIEPVPDDTATEEDYLNALAELGVTV